MFLEENKSSEDICYESQTPEKVETEVEFTALDNDRIKSESDPRTKDEIEEDGRFNFEQCKRDYGTDPNFKLEYVWSNAMGFVLLHSMGVYAIYLFFTQAKIFTPIYFFIMVHFTGLGITAAAHRLWAHRCYKAKTPLKLLLITLQTINGQNSLWYWVREHRLHHRYSDTDADPHNARRGWFFSHMGWLMTKNHPLIKELGKTIDLSDIEADPIVMFQKKYYIPFHFVVAFILPVAIPVLGWNENLWVAIVTCYFFRYLYQLHVTWSLNSFAHTTGMQPYDKTIIPIESKPLALFTLGEGWHNFHHTFPWDYRMGEWGGVWNISATFINLMHRLGQAYDLKMASPEMIKRRMQRTGDGTIHEHIHLKTLSKQL